MMNKNNIINFIKSFGGISFPLDLSKGLLFGAMAGSIMVKYLYGMDCLWWEKLLIGFVFSYIITIIRLFLSKKNNNMDSKIDSSNNCDNTKKMEKVVKFIKGFFLSPTENKISKGISETFVWGTLGGIICICIR